MAFNPLVINGGTEATAQRVTIANDSTGILSVDDNGGSLTIDASSLPLPTGASTSANQSTANGLLTTIDADTGNISTKIDTIAGAVSGTEVQVDVLTMPTTTVQATNLDIRDLTSASDSVAVHGDVGVIDQLDLTNSNPAAVAIVDGNGDQITSFGGGTQYTEDAAAAANPVGTALIGVRADSLAGVTSTDGDNVAARMTDKGELYVKHVDPIPVTQSGTWDEVGINDSGNSITIDNAQLSVVGSGTEATAMRVTIATDSTGVLSVDDNGSSLTVDNAGLTELAAAINGSSQMDVNIAASSATLTVASHAVTNAGTFAVQVDGAALTSLQLIDDAIYAEDVASQAADKGVQVLTVRKDTAAATSGTDGDYQPPVSNARGATWVAIEDGAGGQVTSFGGGTQYTEDAAAAANPVGTAPILVRTDTPATQVSTDGDNIAQRGTNYGAAYVQLVTSAGAYIDSVGGGTQYTEGDTDASITGTAMLMEGAGDTLVAAQGTAADGLLVNLGANNDVTVSGVSTAANQTTIIGHLDGVEGLLTTIDTDTGDIAVDADAIRVAVQLLDDSVQVLGTDTYTEASSKGITLGAVRRDADTTLVNTTNEFTPLQVDANGRLKVEAFSGETLPVNGTVTANLAAGTNNIGDVDILSVPAPLSTTGGGTEAAALRVTIASDSTGVLSVDDNGSSLTVDGTVSVTGVSTLAEQQTQTTALQLIDDVVYTDDTSTHATGTSKGVGIMAAATPTDGSVAANDIGMVAMTVDRKLHVAVMDALPAGTAAIGKLAANSGVDIGDVDILSIAAGDNNIGNVDIVTLPALPAGTNNIGDIDVLSIIPGAGATNLGKAEDAAHTTGDTGVMALGVRRDTPTVSSGTTGDYEPVSMDANGATWVSLATKLDATNDAVAIGSRTTGGLTIFRSIDLDETEEEAKATAGQVYGYYLYNAAATAHYVKFYNATAANVTVGTTTPVITIPLPAGAAANVFVPQGIAFSTAITVAATTGLADADTGAPAANAVVCNLFYT